MWCKADAHTQKRHADHDYSVTAQANYILQTHSQTLDHLQ